MFPESLKEVREQEKNLSTLKSEIDKPGQVKYLRESNDKNYKIYRYKLISGGNRGGIKNKYIEQIGSWVEGTQFTDEKGNEIKKDTFNAGESVYLKVPIKHEVKSAQAKNNEVKNQNEKKNTPGKFIEVNNNTDNMGRKWKIYSYTLLYGGDDSAIESKFQQQYSMYYQYLLPGRNFCDKNGNIINKRNFNKGETVYIKVPNRDVVDKVSEITISEIKKLSDDKIKKIFNSFKTFEGWDAQPNRGSLYEHADKNGRYILLDGKKLYYYTKNKYLNRKPCYFIDENEGIIDSITMGQYDGKDFDCVHCDYRGVRRGTKVVNIKK